MEYPHDVFVQRALEVVPELVDQQEWSAHQEGRASHGLEGEELSLVSVSHFTLGPFLRRLLDRAEPSEDAVLKRLFALLEELLVCGDERATRTAKHQLEWSVFRHRHAESAEPFLGPESRAFLESLGRAFAPFKAVWEVMEACFDDLVAIAKARYPDIGGRALYALGGPGRFGAQLFFMYDGASQRWEDLILDFSVHPPQSSYRTRHLAGAGSRDAVEFCIERGTGKELALLAPRLLPAERGSTEYRDALIDYSQAATELIDERRSAILEALSDPFIPWFISAERNGPPTKPRLVGSAEGLRRWQHVCALLGAGYREVLAALQARRGDIVGEIREPSAAQGALSLSARFTCTSSTDAQAAVTLDFVCAPAQQFFEAEEKEPPIFSDCAERDAVGFQILHGGRRATVVGTLWPALLADTERSADYDTALKTYVERALHYAAGHIEMMLAALDPQSDFAPPTAAD